MADPRAWASLPPESRSVFLNMLAGIQAGAEGSAATPGGERDFHAAMAECTAAAIEVLRKAGDS